MDKKESNISVKAILTIFILSLALEIIDFFIVDFYHTNFIIPYGIMGVGFILLLDKENLIANKKALYLIIPIAMIMLSKSFIDIAGVNLLLNVIILPILITIFFVLLINENVSINDSSFWWLLKLFPCHFIANQINLVNVSLKGRSKNNKLFQDIVLGIIIVIPVVVVVLILLTTADRYFGFLIDNMVKMSSDLISYKLFYHMLMLFIYFFFYQSVYQNIVNNLTVKQATKHSYYKNNTVYKTILWVLNLVYLLFLVSEVSKLTTNFLNLPIEYTYASYAREGFFQLLFIVAINYGILNIFIFLDSDVLNDKTNQKITLWLIANSCLLIFNSFYRMMLYISAYGLTILRMQVVLFLLMSLSLFIITTFKLFKLSFRDRSYIFITLLVFYLLNLYVANQPIIDQLNQLLFIH